MHFNFNEIANYSIRNYDIIPLLLDCAQAAVKEKVIRVIAATFRVGMTMLRSMISIC